MSRILLSINVDHIATLREARGGKEPDPVEGAKICEKSGCDGITVHLREDRRHIQDKDVYLLKKTVKGKFNLEMALSDEIIKIAKKIKPHQVTIVPEKREELTTEGGLDVAKNFKKILEAVKVFHKINTSVSLFVEPDPKVVELAKQCGADSIEIHTGTYCNAAGKKSLDKEIDRIYRAANHAVNAGIKVNAGHGLNYTNMKPILKIPGLKEVSIGHSIIARAVFTGLSKAVQDMIKVIS